MDGISKTQLFVISNILVQKLNEANNIINWERDKWKGECDQFYKKKFSKSLC